MGPSLVNISRQRNTQLGAPIVNQTRSIDRRYSCYFLLGPIQNWHRNATIEAGGAGGSIGTGIVAKAPPDGYTLLLGTVSTQTISPALYSRLQYDPERTPLGIGISHNR
ncbi:MAG: tripartite tricarboxylate transporter substrate-binding protein [Pseudolabrys sp.]